MAHSSIGAGGTEAMRAMQAMLLEEALRPAAIWSDLIPGRNPHYTGNDDVIERLLGPGYIYMASDAQTRSAAPQWHQ